MVRSAIPTPTQASDPVRVRAFACFGFLLGLLLGVGLAAVAHTATIEGNDNANNLGGHEHVDIIRGHGGDDTILGYEDNDQLHGGNGGDGMGGNHGIDDMEGDDGMDDMHGGEPRDTMKGDNGLDFVEGNEGEDDLRGNEGNFDWIDADEGDTNRVDDVSGGIGTDDTCDVDIAPFSGTVLDNIEGGCEHIQ